MPPSGGAGFAGAAVCAAGPVRKDSAWWARERRRLRCRLQAVPALPVPPSAPLARCAGIRHGGRVSDVWSTRAEAFRTSEPHRVGEDLDLLVEWCEPREGVKALDVATGGGHVARRLREEGCEVVTVDPAPGMRADVLAPADHLPFADESFDVVVCRIAAHHFPDLAAAVEEMARVSRRLLVIEDLLFDTDYVEEAHRLRDPTHVRCYSEEEWRAAVTEAGFEG